MKTNPFFLLSLLLTTVSAIAQESNGHFSFTLGPSFPIGDFANKNYDYVNSGMANTGAMFDICIAHKVGNGKFGITGMLRGQSNPIDVLSISRSFASDIPGYKWTAESDGWSASSYMLGAYGTFPISEKAFFEPRTMIGFMAVRCPSLSITGTNSGSEMWLRQSSIYSGSFAFLIGAGVKIDLGEKIYLISNLDYLGSNAQFIDVETVSSNGKRYFDSWSQSIRTINLSLGIALKI